MKNTVILLTILLFFFPFCQGQRKEKNIKVDTLQLYIDLVNNNINRTDTFQLYFPLGIIDEAPTLPNSWREKVYSRDLYHLEEPVIYTDTSHNEIYRFTWLRSRDHPIIIRIEKQENRYMLYWKYYIDEKSEKDKFISCVIIVKQKELDETSWITFINLLHQIDFWNMETNKRGRYFDGAQWILEGKNSSQYHVVDRWSPSRKNKYYQCCDFLIKLTDLKIRNVNKY